MRFLAEGPSFRNGEMLQGQNHEEKCGRAANFEVVSFRAMDSSPAVSLSAMKFACVQLKGC